MKILNQWLDRSVTNAQQLRLGPRPIHPYHLSFDLGLIASICLILCFTAVWPASNLQAIPFILNFLLVYISYERLFLPLKQRVVGITGRSYLQDMLLFILPMHAASCWLLGVPMLASLDLVGLILPLLLSFVRIGCFLGGCCFGLPARIGVRYPDLCFLPHDRSCRTYRAGINPQARVFPVQLVEAAANAALFGLLLWRLAITPVFDGRTLWLYLIGYGVSRFVTDFFRRSSVRPRIGLFSEAQCVAVGMVIVSVSLILVLGSS